MSGTFNMTRGDTAPRLAYALEPTDIDLTGATVQFSMGQRGAAKVIDLAAAVIVTETVTPTVAYEWQPGDTDAAGLFEAQFKVTYADGEVQTFPSPGAIAVSIGESL